MRSSGGGAQVLGVEELGVEEDQWRGQSVVAVRWSAGHGTHKQRSGRQLGHRDGCLGEPGCAVTVAVHALCLFYFI